MPEILADITRIADIHAGGREFIKFITILRRIDFSGCDIPTLLTNLFDNSKHRNSKTYYDKDRQRKSTEHG
jgi:hypothetical protein